MLNRSILGVVAKRSIGNHDEMSDLGVMIGPTKTDGAKWQ